MRRAWRRCVRQPLKMKASEIRRRVAAMRQEMRTCGSLQARRRTVEVRDRGGGGRSEWVNELLRDGASVRKRGGQCPPYAPLLVVGRALPAASAAHSTSLFEPLRLQGSAIGKPRRFLML